MVAAIEPCVSVRPMWGTTIRVEFREPVGDAMLEPLWQWFQHVDDLFSTWRDDSEISRLARGELELAATSAEVRTVLHLCEHMRVTSRGAFDIAFHATTADGDGPGRCRIDPTGLVKGWAVDRAAALLGGLGLADFSINAGGDILVRSGRNSRSPWRIGIQHPWQRDKTAEVVALANGAVATSGNYERGDHVIDPRTGQAARGLTAVTVVASDLAFADAYATAALALGRDGMAWLATIPEVVAFGITDDRWVVKTPGFDAFVKRSQSR